MDRVACVDVPALPLQLLLARDGEDAAVAAGRQSSSPRPRLIRDGEGGGYPVAVVERDDPQGRILWVNEEARLLGILPGQRYAAGLSLARDLRAGVVGAEEIAEGVRALIERLRVFTPEVEASEEEPGVFWLGAGGLERLWSAANRWGEAIHRSLAEVGFVSTVVVAFTRFGSYAVARSRRRVIVFREPSDEDSALNAVPLARLGLEPGLRDALTRLGVRTVAEFKRLPAAGILERFGSEAHRLHRLANGSLSPPLVPAEVEEPLEGTLELEFPEGDLDRLLFGVKTLLDPLLDRLEAMGQVLAALEFGLRQEVGGWRRESLRPARPTLAGAQILDLVRLRLEDHRGRRLAARVEEISLRVRGVRASFEQLRLFVENPRRNLAAAGRALARLRAEFGPEAVVRARLKDGHLPEAQFLWEPIETLETGKGHALPLRTLVRCLRQHPLRLPPRAHQLRDDGWLIRGLEHGPVTRFHGPFIVAGGWWMRPLRREYHFARTQRGDILWVYFDRPRRRWFQQGQVL